MGIEHNTAIDSDDDCSLCVYSKHLNVEMNKHTIVLNNAATVRADGGGVIENNFDSPDLTDYLVDADNYDFRPLADSPLVLANGDYSGAYRPQENTYWIPGFRKSQASFPIPGDGQTLRMGRTEDDALICLLGYQADNHLFYLGADRASVEAAGPESDEFQFSSVNENVFYLGDKHRDQAQLQLLLEGRCCQKGKDPQGGGLDVCHLVQ